MATHYTRFVERWSRGCGSYECEGAYKRVLARGQVPCDVLFVGEAPGESENVIGRPFVGPAGKLLDTIIGRSLHGSGLRYCLTNLVCCIPRSDDGTLKASEPDVDQIRCCAPRLQEFIRLCDPRMIVCVGALARDWLARGFKHSIKLPSEDIQLINITHPAAILRANIAQRGLMVQRAVITLQNAVEELIEKRAEQRSKP